MDRAESTLSSLNMHNLVHKELRGGDTPSERTTSLRPQKRAPSPRASISDEEIIQQLKVPKPAAAAKATPAAGRQVPVADNVVTEDT
jgi:hypothetical protein